MKKRTHIPALGKDQLQIALQKLEKAHLTSAAKKQIAAMVKAAANPNSESPAVVIKTLPKKRRGQIEGLMDKLNQHTNSVLQRAGKALDAMSDEEWNALVEEANGSD